MSKNGKNQDLAVNNRPKRNNGETLEQELEREKLKTSKSDGKIINLSEKSNSEDEGVTTNREDSISKEGF